MWVERRRSTRPHPVTSPAEDKRVSLRPARRATPTLPIIISCITINMSLSAAEAHQPVTTSASLSVCSVRGTSPRKVYTKDGKNENTRTHYEEVGVDTWPSRLLPLTSVPSRPHTRESTLWIPRRSIATFLTDGLLTRTKTSNEGFCSVIHSPATPRR